LTEPVRKRFLKKYLIVVIAAVVLVTIAAMTVIWMQAPDYLLLRDADSGQLYGCWQVSPGDTFSITFIHSVNKSPLTDVYCIEDRSIFVTQTIYNAFGAGVQTEIGPGQTLHYTPEGQMVVSGFHTQIEPLRYIVGTVSDHTLQIGEDTYSLTAMCGRNSSVQFTCEKAIFVPQAHSHESGGKKQ